MLTFVGTSKSTSVLVLEGVNLILLTWSIRAEAHLWHVGLQGLRRSVVQQGFKYSETVLVVHSARNQLLEDPQHALHRQSILNFGTNYSLTPETKQTQLTPDGFWQDAEVEELHPPQALGCLDLAAVRSVCPDLMHSRHSLY